MPKTTTEQEMFDIAVAGILAQGGKSASGGTCLYRGGPGMKCAVGHLIPDQHYRREFESISLNDVITRLADSGGPDLSNHRGFLGALQEVHDLPENGMGYIDRFKQRARDFANANELSIKNIPELKELSS